MKNLILIIFITGIFIGPNVQAQNKTKQSESVKSIDGILTEILNLVSREKGEKADTAAFRNLFLPSAIFTMHTHNDSMAKPIETVSLNEFIELLADPYYGEGFEEIELNKVIDEYNGIAHAFQVYHVKDADGEDETGLNSYQLIYYQERWWIVSVMWTGNSNGIEVPKKYFK